MTLLPRAFPVLELAMVRATARTPSTQKARRARSSHCRTLQQTALPPRAL